MLLLMTVMMAVGGGKAWGQKTTTIYERGTSSSTAWTSADANDWTKSSNGDLSLTDGYYQITTNANGDHSWLKTITYDENAILDVEADVRLFSNTGRYLADGCASYFRFGNIYIAENDQDKASAYSLSSFSGSNNTKFTMSGASYRSSGVDYYIKMQINTANNTLVYLYVYPSASSTTASLSLENQVLTDFDYSTLGVGFYRGGRHTSQKTEILRSIKVTQTTQSVQMAKYSINYVYNDETIKTVSGETTVGSTINAENPITIDEVKYFAVDGATLSMDISSGSNILNVELRKADIYNHTVNAVDSEGNILMENLASGTITEGESLYLAWSKYIKIDDKWYNTTSKPTLTVSADGITNIVYQEADIDYFFEETNFTISHSFAATIGKDFFSNGQGGRLFSNSYAYTEPLEEGIYTMVIAGAINTQTPTMTYGYRLNEENVILGESESFNNGSYEATKIVEGVKILNGASLLWINNTEYNSNLYIDYITLKKTGDLDRATYTVNYIYNDEIVSSESGEYVVGEEFSISENTITVTTGEGEEVTTQVYYLEENQTTSMTIDADAANNVLNVALRLPATLTYTIDAVDANESVLAEIGTGTFTEGESATAYWSKYINVNGQWYETTAPYGATISTEGSTNVKYSGSDITYFYEIENMKTSKKAASSASGVNYSNGSALGHTASERFYTNTPIDGGIYTVTVNGSSRRSGTTRIGVSYIDDRGNLHDTGKELTWTNTGTEAVSMTVEDVEIPANNKGIALVELTGYNSVTYSDYVTFTKTGEVLFELITVTSAGARTYCSENNLDFSNVEGLTAYCLTVSGDQITTTPVDVVDSYSGIYLEGAEGSYEVPFYAGDVTSKPENVLVGVTEEVVVTDLPIYVLMNESNGVGFYKANNGSFTVGAHTAYIPGSVVSADVKALTFGSDDPATGIKGIVSDAVLGKDAVIYNLAGQRVAAPTKGIYIVNGKKVMVK